jgi:hypothetical protein
MISVGSLLKKSMSRFQTLFEKPRALLSIFFSRNPRVPFCPVASFLDGFTQFLSFFSSGPKHSLLNRCPHAEGFQVYGSIIWRLATIIDTLPPATPATMMFLPTNLRCFVLALPLNAHLNVGRVIDEKLLEGSTNEGRSR